MNVTICRGVVPGGAMGAMAHPDFGRSVNPISTRGTDYAHLITTGTPGFSDLPTVCIIDINLFYLICLYRQFNAFFLLAYQYENAAESWPSVHNYGKK